MGFLAEHREVSREAEDKLAYRLGLAAGEKCKELIDAYNACLNGRTISAAWACRSTYNASQACLRKYVTEENIETMKQRWLDQGRPKYPDWAKIMEGLVE